MIYGIGTDLVAVDRLREIWSRHGERALAKFLAPDELAEFQSATGDPARFLAKRFAAKEALGKALGTGIRAPVLLTAIAVTHNELGRPEFSFTPALAEYLAPLGLTAHLSLSDERNDGCECGCDFAQAFVVLEQRR